MAGPLPYFTPGKSSITALAMMWEVECLRISKSTFFVMTRSISYEGFAGKLIRR